MAGAGSVYQGRFKYGLFTTGEEFLTFARYMERNALGEKLVRQLENWRWSSL